MEPGGEIGSRQQGPAIGWTPSPLTYLPAARPSASLHRSCPSELGGRWRPDLSAGTRPTCNGMTIAFLDLATSGVSRAIMARFVRDCASGLVILGVEALGTVFPLAATALAEASPHIVRAYKVGLRDLRSPLALRADAWSRCRHQAESIIADCVAALRGEDPAHRMEVWRYSGLVGSDRVAQGIGVAESIRAGEVLWTAFQDPMKSAARCEGDDARLPVFLCVVGAFRFSLSSRLYAGAVAYDRAVADASALRGSTDDVVGDRARADELLSPRERDVLKGLEKGLSNVQIAHQLGITPATVKRHVHNIYARLGAVSRVDAVNKARAPL